MAKYTEEQQKLYNACLVTLQGPIVISYPKLYEASINPKYPDNLPKFSASFLVDRNSPTWELNRKAIEAGIAAAYELGVQTSTHQRGNYMKLAANTLKNVFGRGVYATYWDGAEYRFKENMHNDPAAADQPAPQPEGIEGFALLSASTGEKQPPKLFYNFMDAAGKPVPINRFNANPILGGHNVTAVQVRFSPSTKEVIACYLQAVTMQATFDFETRQFNFVEGVFGLLGGSGGADVETLASVGDYQALPEGFDFNAPPPVQGPATGEAMPPSAYNF